MNYHHWKHTYVTIIWRDNTFELCPKEHCCQNKAMTGTIPTTSTVKPVEIQHKLIWKYCLHSQNFIIQGFEALIEVCCRYLLIYLFVFFFVFFLLVKVYRVSTQKKDTQIFSLIWPLISKLKQLFHKMMFSYDHQHIKTTVVVVVIFVALFRGLNGLILSANCSPWNFKKYYHTWKDYNYLIWALLTW